MALYYSMHGMIINVWKKTTLTHLSCIKYWKRYSKKTPTTKTPTSEVGQCNGISPFQLPGAFALPIAWEVVHYMEDNVLASFTE